MADCDTLREELAIKYPKHGHALREPDPGGLYIRVEVGDVGVIRDGCFYPLFNALNPPSNPNSHHGPKYPPPLQPKRSPHIRSSTDDQRYFCSDNVKKVPCDLNPFTLGPDDEAPLTFSCSGKKGALLYLPLLAERHDTVARGDFGQWMRENIDACFKVAEDLGYGVERMEDIILVTGCHLAKSWVSVAFSESRGGSQVSFGARVSDSSSVHFDERNVNGRGLKFGPGGENLPQNQCIFVRGFRVTRILNIWPKLRGAGPAPDLGEREPESDRHLELISIPADTDYLDPLHALSAHIAEQVPDCDMILVHDDDLQSIDEAPDELMRHTQCYSPAIRQVLCEVSPGDDAESGSDVAINTVATLSKDVFEAPHEDWSDLEHSHPMAITNGPANAVSRPNSPENAGLGPSLSFSVPQPEPDESSGFLGITYPTNKRLLDTVSPRSDTGGSSRGSYISPLWEEDHRSLAITYPRVRPPIMERPFRFISGCVWYNPLTAPDPEPNGRGGSSRKIDPHPPLSHRHTFPPHPPLFRCREFQKSESLPAPEHEPHGGGGSSTKIDPPLPPSRRPIIHTPLLPSFLRGTSHMDESLPAPEHKPHIGAVSSSKIDPPHLLSRTRSIRRGPCRLFGPGPEHEPGCCRSSSKNDPPCPLSSVDSIRPSRQQSLMATRFPPVQRISTLAVSHRVETSFSRSQDPPRDVPYSQGTGYIRQNAPSTLPPSLQDTNSPRPRHLDVVAERIQVTLVPQGRLTTPSEWEVYRHGNRTMPLPPIFFVDRNDGVGLWLPDIVQARSYDTCERDTEAPLERRETTHIRINLPAYYDITSRDLTNALNLITLARFMDCVDISFDELFNIIYICDANGHEANPEWGIVWQDMMQSHITIIGAVHVSADTWMPIIQLRRRAP